MTPQEIEKHKQRILIGIKVAAKRSANHVPKPPKRVWKHQYSVKKYAGRYLPWER